MQDTENGGISDRPDDAVDVYHTYFGIAGASYFLKQTSPTSRIPIAENQIFVNLKTFIVG